MNAPHTYAEAGTYTVTLTVTDNHGGSGSDTLTVTVKKYVSVCTLPDLKAMLTTMYDDGDISRRAAYLSLRALVNVAAQAFERDRVRVAHLTLRLFIEEGSLFERRGWITGEAGVVLRDSAQCLMDNL